MFIEDYETVGEHSMEPYESASFAMLFDTSFKSAQITIKSKVC